MMEQVSQVYRLTNGNYFVGEASYLKGYSGLNRKPV